MNHWELNQQAFLQAFKHDFNDSDLKELCFNLKIKYGDLAGATFSERAISLYEHCQRTRRLSDLVDECEKMRPTTNWRGLLQPAPPPKPITIPPKAPTKHGLWLLVAGVVLVGVAWLVWGNGREANISAQQDAIVYDFEQQDEAEQWALEFAGQTSTPVRSTETAFNGRYAIKVSTNLQAADLRDPSADLPQLITTVPETQNKAIVIRLFTPQTAPSNVAAQIFLREEGSTIWGPYSRLVPGQWTTLSWLTTDVPPAVIAFTQLGIEIKMDSVKKPGDDSEYKGQVYLDMVEILPYTD